MTDEELAAALVELDETRETLERLQHDRDTVLEFYANIAKKKRSRTSRPKSDTASTSCSG